VDSTRPERVAKPQRDPPRDRGDRRAGSRVKHCIKSLLSGSASDPLESEKRLHVIYLGRFAAKLW
jgi:hypothetical protein